MRRNQSYTDKYTYLLEYKNFRNSLTISDIELLIKENLYFKPKKTNLLSKNNKNNKTEFLSFLENNTSKLDFLDGSNNKSIEKTDLLVEVLSKKSNLDENSSNNLDFIENFIISAYINTKKNR